MNIVILTGAGISAESGLGTFRDENGLWTKVRIEDVATPEAFARDPQTVLEFYNARRRNCLDAQPNAAHAALARLQRAPQHQVTLVTQNVDDLHERGGSPEVIHMHGELRRGLCLACGHRWAQDSDMAPAAPCPACRTPGARPDIVWFGEMPYHLDRIETALHRADLFVAIGTSGAVYPAAGYVDIARAAGIDTLELNLAPSDGTHLFAAHRFGPATEVVPEWVAELTAG